MAQLPLSRTPRPELRYVRPPEPVVFPTSEEMPESKVHLNMRQFLYGLLRFALGPGHSVGSEQFIYWNARNPKRCLAPDAFVKLGVPDTDFGSWKTWERGGVPELAVEVQSDSDADAGPWEKKLERYRELGVQEIVRIDPQAPEGHRLAVWDRVQEDLVERVVTADRTPCMTLGVDWVIAPRDGVPFLRLHDGTRLLPTSEEVSNARADAAKAREEAANARIRELEAELARRR